MLPAKFLASAFATGPALIILICFLLKKLTGFDAGEKAIKMLSTTAIYAYIATMIMMAGEFFTAYYSGVPAHKIALTYLFFGYHGHNEFVPLMMLFVVCVIVTLVLLIPTKFRYNKATMIVGCICLFLSMYIEKGLTVVIGGLSENPFGEIVDYIPGKIELAVIVGVFAIGILILSILLKMVTVVKYDNDEGAFPDKPDRVNLAYRLNEAAGTYVDTRPKPEPEPEEEASADDAEAPAQA